VTGVQTCALPIFSVSVRFSLKHIGSVVPYLALTTGSYQVEEITDDLITIEESERNYSYYGIGGGLRFYYTDSASIHAEMIQISKKLSDGKNLKSDTPKSESEIKATVGLGWEF
jgi:hypothetical protein